MSRADASEDAVAPARPLLQLCSTGAAGGEQTPLQTSPSSPEVPPRKDRAGDGAVVQPAPEPALAPRLRTACDACRQAKIRCLGGNPCPNCQWSQIRCNHSPGGRLGRPKGSKNKRPLSQQQQQAPEPSPLNSSNTGHSDVGAGKSGVAHSAQRTSCSRPGDEHGQPQKKQRPSPQPRSPPPSPPIDSISFDLGLDHWFDTTGAFSDSPGPVSASAAGGDNSHLIDPLLDFVTDGTTHDLLAQNSVLGCFSDALSSASNHTFMDLGNDQHLQTTTSPCSPTTTHSSIFSRGGITSASSETGQYITPLTGPSRTPLGLALPVGDPSSAPQGHAGCACLPQLARLLYELEKLRSDPSVDSVLKSVQVAEPPWEALMRCTTAAPEHSHKEALLLFSMSIRILLLSVQRLSSSIEPAGGAVQQQQAQQQQQLAHTQADGEQSLDVLISVGGFELAGDAKVEVIGVLVKRAQQTISRALINLSNSTGRRMMLTTL